ncbi:hypothetical protein FPZ42_12155 [Mucilaginibacter achroorhodeus]|uniref:histidine kinase n=1 Tax=Mucilaginibacter achroorhodeus TaxID=2599294 RepID=A0A563U238_9SPHI|nr:MULTISPECIES: histidine kinase dimerization/phospho-acceptor domain-containing protein [Mucilaginibacter]QXV67475.1 hypothetical protein INP83_10445 [Mucilaginibacter sp. 21P]TWR25352.1 hypothetical protein FPZ42_12155 [Mucilaginibacter achroorhodeus]
MMSTSFSFQRSVQLVADSKNFYLVKIDTQGNYVYMNDLFLERHSAFYNKTEVRPASIALHTDDHAASFKTYQLCVADPDKTFPITLRKLDGKGGYIITYWEYKADLDAGGNITGVIGIGHDVAAFESRPEHIGFLTQTLNTLASQQSHDLRRPLANVLGLVEVLKILGEDNDQLQDVVKKLEQSCKQLDDEFEAFLIRDLGNKLG